MFFLLRTLVVALMGLLLIITVALTLLVDRVPQKPLQWQPNQQMARDIFKKASIQAKSSQDLTFDQPELTHILNSLLNRYLNSITQINIQDDDTAVIETSLQLPKKFYGYYLNIRFELHNDQKGLKLQNLCIGNLSIHTGITKRVVNHLLRHSFLRHYYRLGVQHIQTLQFKNHQLIASYALNANATGLANANTVDLKVLAFYQQQIDILTSQHDPNWRLSLADLLAPLFKIANKRTSLKEAITDNIAIIYAVSTYVNTNQLPFYLSINQPVVNKYLYPVYLYKRTDQAKHFMLSAVLTASGGTQLADIMGQEKELRDVQTKSGFSFIDLAADRAGMKFSEQATRSPEVAKALQSMMAEVKDYRTFMPDVHDLPEKMTQAEFIQQFDGVGSKSYKALLEKIDQRIMALPIYSAHP